MNGWNADSTTWLGRSEGTPMPLQLYDYGYDVYMANNRGTKYSQEHVTMTWDEDKWWDWTWADMGVQDALANIRVINRRNDHKKKISYLGYS